MNVEAGGPTAPLFLFPLSCLSTLPCTSSLHLYLLSLFHPLCPCVAVLRRSRSLSPPCRRPLLYWSLHPCCSLPFPPFRWAGVCSSSSVVVLFFNSMHCLGADGRPCALDPIDSRTQRMNDFYRCDLETMTWAQIPPVGESVSPSWKGVSSRPVHPPRTLLCSS